MIDREDVRDFTKNFFVVLSWIAAFFFSMFLLVGAFALHPLIGFIVLVIYAAAYIAAVMTR